MNRLTRLAAASGLLAASLGAQALTFNFTYVAGTSPDAIAAFNAAGAWWSSVLSDNVTLDMTVGTKVLGAGVLAATSSAKITESYTDVRSSLATHATSALDATAVAHLPGGNSVDLLINRTKDNPNGSGAPTPYLDNNGSANNTTMRLTTADAKVLGFSTGTTTASGCATTCDAYIAFNTNYSYDFNRTDGISSGTFDFIGLATHELGHALGFTSGVDILDTNSSSVLHNADEFTYLSTLDLFRYSAQSVALGVNDWTADTRSKYFSVDGGVTVGPAFSTGSLWGDGQQNSHWKDKLGLGILDPTAAAGELLIMSDNDRMAMDAIGWTLAAAVPEPSTYAMFGLGVVAIAVARRKSNKA